MVMVPPRMAVKPIGISKRDMGRPERADMRDTTGRKRAAAPTFCMNEEINPTVAEMIGMMRHSVVPPTFRMNAATLLMIPVLSSPAPMIMTAMIEITALEENPSNRCLLSTSPCSRPMNGASKRGQPKQHHNRNGRDVDADDLKGEKVDRQNQNGADPGDFNRRNHGRQETRQGYKYYCRDRLFTG